MYFNDTETTFVKVCRSILWIKHQSHNMRLNEIGTRYQAPKAYAWQVFKAVCGSDEDGVVVADFTRSTLLRMTRRYRRQPGRVDGRKERA